MEAITESPIETPAKRAKTANNSSETNTTNTTTNTALSSPSEATLSEYSAKSVRSNMDMFYSGGDPQMVDFDQDMIDPEEMMSLHESGRDSIREKLADADFYNDFEDDFDDDDI